MALERFTYATMDITGSWDFVNKNTYIGCDYLGHNKNKIDYGTMRIVKQTSANAYVLQSPSKPAKRGGMCLESAPFSARMAP